MNPIHVCETRQELLQTVTQQCVEQIYTTLIERRDCLVWLSACDPWLDVFALLTMPPYCDRVQWGKLRFRWQEAQPDGRATASRLQSGLFDYVEVPGPNRRPLEAAEQAEVDLFLTTPGEAGTPPGVSLAPQAVALVIAGDAAAASLAAKGAGPDFAGRDAKHARIVRLAERAACADLPAGVLRTITVDPGRFEQ